MIRHPSDMAVDWCVRVYSRLQLPAVQEPRLESIPPGHCGYSSRAIYRAVAMNSRTLLQPAHCSSVESDSHTALVPW